MAVKELVQNDKSYLDLRFDNGDIAKLNEVMKKWNFKDYQSFFRFTVSIMLVSDDNFLAISVNGEPKAIKPSPEYIYEE